MPSLEDAILLAVQAHQGQRDKNGQPYLLHPLRVMFRVDSDHERMAAVLHDVIEDTPHTLEELRELGYPAVVVDAVDCLTRRSTETYDEFVERSAANPIARRVKLADLEDNMDIRRLETFAANDAERMRKYLHAWQTLKGLQ